MCASRPDNAWADRRFIVAGASAGVGRALAQRLVEQGATVGMVARRSQLLDQAAAELGDKAIPLVADMADPDQVRAAFAAFEAHVGRLDALFNVAGTARARRLEDLTDDDIANVVGTNLLGPIHTMRAAIPLLRRAGTGDIVNVSSEIVIDYLPLLALYAATKAGLDRLTRSMTRELRTDGIRVTLVVLGRTGETGFSSNFSPDEAAALRAAWADEGYTTRVSDHAPMAVSDVVEAILFAASRPRSMVLDVVQVRSSGLPGGRGHRTD